MLARVLVVATLPQPRLSERFFTRCAGLLRSRPWGGAMRSSSQAAQGKPASRRKRLRSEPTLFRCQTAGNDHGPGNAGEKEDFQVAVAVSLGWASTVRWPRVPAMVTRGVQGSPGNAFWNRERPGRREQPAHDLLIRRAMLADMPLTGLSSEPAALQRFCRSGEAVVDSRHRIRTV